MGKVVDVLFSFSEVISLSVINALYTFFDIVNTWVANTYVV